MWQMMMWIALYFAPPSSPGIHEHGSSLGRQLMFSVLVTPNCSIVSTERKMGGTHALFLAVSVRRIGAPRASGQVTPIVFVLKIMSNCLRNLNRPMLRGLVNCRFWFLTARVRSSDDNGFDVAAAACVFRRFYGSLNDITATYSVARVALTIFVLALMANLSLQTNLRRLNIHKNRNFGTFCTTHVLDPGEFFNLTRLLCHFTSNVLTLNVLRRAWNYSYTFSVKNISHQTIVTTRFQRLPRVKGKLLPDPSPAAHQQQHIKI